MITFKNVRWKNFLSTGNTFTNVELDRNPSTLIVGENGAGKSTILDALCFGLFGKPFRTISKNQLINSINGRDSVVEVEFETQNKKVKVVRGIKPNIFEVYVDGVLINQNANARDYQKHLEQQVLKLNYRSFTQVVILGSSTFIPFMQLSSKNRREVVEDILDIKIFSLMNFVLKTKVKTLNTDIGEVNYDHDICENKIELQEKYVADVKRNKNTLLSQKNSAKDANEEEIFSRQKEVNRLQEENTTLLGKMVGEEKYQSKSIEYRGITHTLKEKHNACSKHIKFFDENDDCPVCQQHIDEKFKLDIVTEKKNQLEKYQNGLNELSDEVKKTNDKIAEYREIAKVLRDNEVEVATINSTIIQLEKFNSTLEVEIKQLNEGDITNSDMEKLQELQKKLEGFNAQKTKLKEDMFYYDVARNLLQDTGIKTKIVKQYLPIMNKLVNTYLSSMDFFVNFNLDENFNETIKSRFRDEFSYANFSEGEKMRIDLAKMKNSTNTNLLILDEIFDSSLDGSGTDDFLKILNTFTDENVFVISHKQDILFDKFRSTLRFEKVKNFSKLAI